MPERDLVIAVVLAALLHWGVGLVRAPALNPETILKSSPLEISIIPAYTEKPDRSPAAAHAIQREKPAEPEEPEDAAPERKEEKKTEKKVEVRTGEQEEKQEEKKTDIPVAQKETAPTPVTIPAEKISKIPPPPQTEHTTTLRPEEIKTEPATPRYKKNPPPEYPEMARRRGYEGEVLLAVLVSVNGTVASVKVKDSSGHSILDRAAVRAVAAWEFEPARRMGSPVPLWVDIPVRFVLKGR